MAEDTIKDEEYAPITKGVREYIERHPTMMHAVGLTDLCDNIDVIHRSLEQENKEMFDFCDRLKAAVEYREDVTLYGVDYIPVPLDKDGVPIHIGDVVECISNGKKRQLSVDECRYRSDGWHVSVMVETCIRQEYMPSELHHYVPDTWERIIHDAMQAGGNITENTPPLVARCKALCERTREGEE